MPRFLGDWKTKKKGEVFKLPQFTCPDFLGIGKLRAKQALKLAENLHAPISWGLENAI